MWVYYLQKHKYKHKVSLPKILVLHMYMALKITTNIKKTTLIPIMTILTGIHTIYNNTNINTKSSCQNAQSYMCMYPHQQYTNLNTKGCFKNAQSYMCK